MVRRRPGSRLEPAYLRRVASEAGLRIIGIDRPGYGLSTPQPGRTIAGWVPEALAVADHLGIGQFAAVGISTGGAYALALAALAPARVLGVVACCSMTDMRWPEGRATMSWPHVQAVWEARDRAAALAAATDAHGEDGSKMRGEIAAVLAPSDLALFGDPGWMKETTAGKPADSGSACRLCMPSPKPTTARSGCTAPAATAPRSSWSYRRPRS